jgi:hypothetical protein
MRLAWIYAALAIPTVNALVSFALVNAPSIQHARST